MLKLIGQPEIGMYIRDVLFPRNVKSNNFLPGEREFILPVAMPFCLGLPPPVAN